MKKLLAWEHSFWDNILPEHIIQKRTLPVRESPKGNGAILMKKVKVFQCNQALEPF